MSGIKRTITKPTVIRRWQFVMFIVAALVLGMRLSTIRSTAHSTLPSGEQVDSLLRYLAAKHWHGTNDDGKPIAELDALEHVTLTCDYVSQWALSHVRRIGVPARLIAMRKLSLENDGHAALEIFHPGYAQWVVVDLTFNRMYLQTAYSFQRERGVWVSLADDPLSPEDTGDYDPEDAYKRVAGVLFIVDGGYHWHYDASHQEMISQMAVHYKYEPGFMARFYR